MNKGRFVTPASQEERQLVRGLDIGEGFALIGTQLIPMVAGEELVIYLAAIGGKPSPITGLEPKPVVLREIARVPLAGVRGALAGGGAGSDGAPVADTAAPATDDAEPDTSSPLILGGPLRAVK